jgi:hypothetical protein
MNPWSAGESRTDASIGVLIVLLSVGCEAAENTRRIVQIAIAREQKLSKDDALKAGSSFSGEEAAPRRVVRGVAMAASRRRLPGSFATK